MKTKSVCVALLIKYELCARHMDVQNLHIYTYAVSPRTRRNVCCLKDNKQRKPAVSRLTIEAGSRSHILLQKQDHPNVI